MGKTSQPLPIPTPKLKNPKAIVLELHGIFSAIYPNEKEL
jgi:hypothetical protein